MAVPDAPLRDPAGNPVLWETCITLNDHWGYTRDDHHFKSPAHIIQMLADCVSKGGNLLLNAGPTAKGEIQKEATDILTAVGHWMHDNAESIHHCGPADDMPQPPWGRYTRGKDNTLYAHIFHRPMGPIAFHNLAGKITRARFLADASELPLDTPWNVPANSPHLHANLPNAPLPDETTNTVLALYSH
jgi:alpha-L-fucosidase